MKLFFVYHIGCISILPFGVSYWLHKYSTIWFNIAYVSDVINIFIIVLVIVICIPTGWRRQAVICITSIYILSDWWCMVSYTSSSITSGL